MYNDLILNPRNPSAQHKMNNKNFSTKTQFMFHPWALESGSTKDETLKTILKNTPMLGVCYKYE
jgi:hypothetical protein